MISRQPGEPTPAQIRDALRDLIDPEIGLNVVDLGMIGDVTIAPDGAVIVELWPTTPGCPMRDTLAAGAQHLLGGLPGVTAVEMHFRDEPAWTPDRIAPEARVRLGLL